MAVNSWMILWLLQLGDTLALLELDDTVTVNSWMILWLLQLDDTVAVNRWMILWLLTFG